MKAIALDIGSSFIKSAVLDTQAGTLSHKTRAKTPERLPHDLSAYFEIDAEEIYQTVKALIDEQRQKEPGIEAILFSTQMHGFILTKGTAALTPYVSWQDARADLPRPGGSWADQLAARLGPETILQMGTRYKAGIAACSLFAYLKEQPVDLNGAMFHTLGSYLIYRLSGQTHHACHVTSAASTGFAHAAKGCWNGKVIEAVGAETLQFPTIVPETQMLGTYQGAGLYADIGDHQASVYGAGEDIYRSVVITIGTGTIVCAPAHGFAKADMEVRPFFEGNSLLTITRQPGGRAMDVVIDLFEQAVSAFTGQTPDRQRLWEVLWETIPDDGAGLMVDADFYIGQGEGRIGQISPSNLTPQTLFAATLDGMAASYAKAISALKKINPALQHIVLCGGKLSKSAQMRQRIEKATGMSVSFSPHEDEALWGLMQIAKQL